MFRNRYISFNKQRNYIRQCYVFNASSQFSTKERYTEVDGDDNMSTTSNNGFIQMDIYNDEKINEKLSKKNSEVTSEENSETTSDDEDEVTSEDLETASDDEDETTSEEDPDENEVTNEEDFDDEINVDKSFTTRAYDELVDIIRHPQFRSEDVIPNSRRFRKYRQRLPLLPIKSRRVHISDKKTPSTSKKIGRAYSLSISDIICQILNNPSLFNKMYFGPGQEVANNKELWHGNIWKESSRFGQSSIIIANVTYHSGDFVIYKESNERRFGRVLAIIQQDNRLKIKIQRILRYEELPKNLQSNSRKERSREGEVWFFDREMDNAIAIVELQAIVKLVLISILYDNVSNGHSIKIREILYKYNDHWKLRDVKYSYQHPSEFALLEEPVTNRPVYKLFIDLYYDDFGTLRNVYHSLGGVYIQVGNMPFYERRYLKNHFVLGFVPFGGSFDEFIKPFIAEMKVLEKGKIMNIQGKECLVIASLGDITSDLVQGNDLAGVKRHGANRGCRTCNATKDSLTSDVDLQLISRYHQQSDKQFEEICAASTLSECKNLATEYGLHLQPPILSQLQWERHLQSPQDAYHATAGKVLRFLKITIDALLPEGKSKFIITWKNFEYPRTWHKLPNPISHIDSFMMSDCLRLAMVIPFILNRFLKPQHFKQSEIEKFQMRMDVSRSNLAIKLWVKCWILVSKTMAMVFKSSFTEEDYAELRKCLDNERKLLSQAFKDFENLPNLHVNFHLMQHAKSYATLLNTSVETKEMMHRILKSAVPRTNLKNVSLDLLKHYTTLFAVRHLLDGGIDMRFSTSNHGFMNLPHHLQRMMSDWFIIKGEVNIEDDADEVYLKKRIVRRHVDASLLLNFQAELALAYEDLEDYSMNQNSSPVFFEYARFYIKENDDIVQCRLHVGDIVTINTEEFGGSFAVIRAIFYHQKNNFRFTFIIIDWFEDMNRTKLGCPVYRLQTANNWRRIFSISLVNAVNTVHFVHDCKDGECAGGNHDFRNNLYMRNLYLFNAV
uniref:BAH domain-containing protein n=1 Tax=Rhizophagus irregularis (strain DAOM 181602 / DAOM 197198 / MUCL 43194) TaxID=747089 RepID=U9TWW1_RHIID